MMFTLNTGNPYVLTAELALREAVPVLSRLARDPSFLDSHVLPLLEEAGRAGDWYVAYGSLSDYARLKKLWPLGRRREDGISTVLPYERGIHRVGNPTEKPAISVHLYGPRLGEIDGRDYDPSQNYVCDRPEDR
jgi:hypothetical protein